MARRKSARDKKTAEAFGEREEDDTNREEDGEADKREEDPKNCR